jgi:hypothetical protein
VCCTKKNLATLVGGTLAGAYTLIKNISPSFPGLPNLSWHSKKPKWGKISYTDHNINQNAIKYVHQLALKYQIAVKYIKIFHSKAFKSIPKVEFWNENIPSGNPVDFSPNLC